MKEDKLRKMVDTYFEGEREFHYEIISIFIQEVGGDLQEV